MPLTLLQLHAADLRSLCIDDVLLQPVDIVITRILRPHWHKVPAKAKQLVGELCTLRTLVKSLLKNDCVRSSRTAVASSTHQRATAADASPEELARVFAKAWSS